MCIRDRSSLVNLTNLSLRSTPISDISVLSSLVNLTNLNLSFTAIKDISVSVSYTHLRAHETVLDLVCRLLLEKKNNKQMNNPILSDTMTSQYAIN